MEVPLHRLPQGVGCQNYPDCPVCGSALAFLPVTEMTAGICRMLPIRRDPSMRIESSRRRGPPKNRDASILVWTAVRRGLLTCSFHRSS